MSAATWRLTIDTTDTRIVPGGAPNRWVVEGAGALPVLERLTPAEPVLPVGDRYAPRPGEDTSRFIFPTDGPRDQARDYDRTYPLGDTQPGRDYYALEASAGNPSMASHVNAGIIASGGMTDYGSQPGKAVGGLRLWVRAVAGEDPLTGKALPAAPGHLIRRALAKGRL